jgi:NTE family protein
MSKDKLFSQQRALVFQGGGSLGAYEAGVFHVLYHWIKKDLPDNENIFDIITGTSIGAINASIIISHFLENKEKDAGKTEDEKSRNTLKYWEGSAEKLIRFWHMISSHNTFYDFGLSLLKNSWDFSKNISAQLFPFYENYIDTIVSGESLRRYYSTKKMIIEGEAHVFNPLFFPPFPTLLFNKFFDYSPSAWWYQYSNLPLKKFILEFAPKLQNNAYNEHAGIGSDIDKNEPRFLLVAANIKTAEPEAFDSYDENNITVNHVLASAAIPINFPYTEINGNKYWDGGILSNTPVRELISSHTKFWTKKIKNKLENIIDSKDKLSFDKWNEFYRIQKEDSIPKLSMFIVNLYPDSEDGNQIPSLFDYDLTKDREGDIRFHDKTDYDIKLSLNVSDYHTFVEKMTELVSDSIKEIKDRKPIVDQLKQRFETIINAEQRTLTRDNEPRYFYDLIGKRFDINDVLKIQRRDDEHTISDKIYDFSSATVSDLINQGEKDALLAILEHKENVTYKDKQRGKEESIYNQLTKFIENVKKSNTEFDQNIIRCTQKEFQKKPA